MSGQRRLRRRSDEESSDATTTTDAADLLGVLNDDYARELLEAVAGEAKTARDLVTECSASRATVYRRLNRLEETGLVETEMTFDADGHHRTAYRATDTDVTVALDRTGLTAELG
jgi:predicted transcriptional regulator